MADPTRATDDPVVTLLQRTLAGRAADALPSVDLAAAARSRRRQRLALRSGLVGAAAIGVVAAVGIPVLVMGSGAGLTALDGPGSGSTPAVSEPVYEGLPPVQPLADGWRWETYGGIELQVPAEWRTGGGQGPWCVNGGSSIPRAYVSRPVGATPAIGCVDEPRERWVPYVEFAGPDAPGREDLGDGWIRETRQVGDQFVTVRADDPSLLDQILASANTVNEVDAVGCPADYIVTQSLDARPTTGGLDPAKVGAEGVVCQYELDGDPTRQPLIASRRLTADEVRAFVDAMADAPVGGGPDEPDSCLPEWRRGDSALLVRLPTTDGARDVIVWYAGCFNGADDGVTLRTLTADLLHPLFGGPVVATSFTMSLAPLMKMID